MGGTRLQPFRQRRKQLQAAIGADLDRLDSGLPEKVIWAVAMGAEKDVDKRPREPMIFNRNKSEYLPPSVVPAALGADSKRGKDLDKRQDKEDSKKLKFDETEDKYDSLGNKIEVVKQAKELTRDEKKRLMKQKKEMEKAGQDTYEIDVLLGLA
jgi:hypothetical protein